MPIEKIGPVEAMNEELEAHEDELVKAHGALKGHVLFQVAAIAVGVGELKKLVQPEMLNLGNQMHRRVMAECMGILATVCQPAEDLLEESDLDELGHLLRAELAFQKGVLEQAAMRVRLAGGVIE